MITLQPKVIHRLAHKGIPKEEFESALGESFEFTLQLLKAQGMNITLHQDRYCFESSFQPIEETLFCIVDIETNGSKPAHHQIIEIGAVKLLNGKIIETFERLVQCHEIPDLIQEITGITPSDTANAPTLAQVMGEFRLFLGQAIFVGHAAKFDYSFVSAMMERVGLSPLQNRSLCTIDLAERTIASERYGLAYLNEQLELYDNATHHRALSDAMTTTKLLKRTLQALPKELKTAEDMIAFSKEGKRLKRPKTEESNQEKEE